jgi:hypothetical protein
LDSFISTIPGFDGGVLILVVPASTQPLGDESVSGPSVGARSSASKTQASKRKAAANLTPQKRLKNPWGDLQEGSKQMNPYPNLLLQLLHRVLRKGSQFFGQIGIPVMMILLSFS